MVEDNKNPFCRDGGCYNCEVEVVEATELVSARLASGHTYPELCSTGLLTYHELKSRNAKLEYRTYCSGAWRFFQAFKTGDNQYNLVSYVIYRRGCCGGIL